MSIRTLLCSIFQSTLITTAAGLTAQEAVLRGQVVTLACDPVAGADVFLLETLEGATTQADGTFALETGYRGEATLVVRGLGYSEGRVSVALPRTEPVRVTVRVVGVALEPIEAAAGSFNAGAGESDPLTPLDVVTTPGAHADVLQAVRSLPGTQPVEEGAALYVRGGDVAETKVLLDGAVVMAPYRFESGLLSFGTFDPFELEEISFSTGGFGARHGDALSGLLALKTAGAPARREAAATASLAAVAGRLSFRLGDDTGFRLAANRSSTELMFRLNGYDTDFVRVPESRNVGGSATWEYRRGGRVKLYVYDEWNRFAVSVDAPSYEGAFTGEDGSGLWVLSVSDVAGPVGIWGSVSGSRRAEQQVFGAFMLDQGDRLYQTRATASWQALTGLEMTLGGGAEWRRSDLEGSYPESGSDHRPGAVATVFESGVYGGRWAAFAEATWRPAGALEFTGGLRRDASSLTDEATWDPRLSAVLRLTDGVHVTGAWGEYHQVPDPLLYAPVVGDPSLPAMESEHVVAGVVVESETSMLRVEVYRKRYRELAQDDRSYRAVGGGAGSTRGVDVFARGRGPLGLEGRVTYSFVDAERTDPNTGILATSPYEIRHSLQLVLERGFGSRFSAAGTLRLASGRPYTPVVSATRDNSSGVWEPVYGPPMSERLRGYARVDLTSQYIHSFSGDDLAVLFVSVTNLLNQTNVMAVQYTDDYSEPQPVTSAFRRTVYFGVSTTFPF